MSYAPDPAPNPYAAPISAIEPEALDQTTLYVGYAGFWRRVAAYIIDYVLGRLVSSILQASVIGALGNRHPPYILYLLLLTPSLVLIVAYNAGMESSSTQATLGKMAMGLKVTDLYGRRLSFGRALARLASKILSVATLGIGYFMVAFTEKKQGLHDMMAGTLVLRTR